MKNYNNKFIVGEIVKYIIDIDALKECLDLLPTSCSDTGYVELESVKKMIDRFPKEEYGTWYKELIEKLVNLEDDDEEEEENVKRGHWVYWSGWCSNHDMRIEDAVCSECGYKHPTVRREYGKTESHQDVLNKLSDTCPGCGAPMEKV